jgi:hypothetical protein
MPNIADFVGLFSTVVEFLMALMKVLLRSLSALTGISGSLLQPAIDDKYREYSDETFIAKTHRHRLTALQTNAKMPSTHAICYCCTVEVPCDEIFFRLTRAVIRIRGVAFH